jgi:hypothetical protein
MRANAPRLILATASTARLSCSRAPRLSPSGAVGIGEDDWAIDAETRSDKSVILLA